MAYKNFIPTIWNEEIMRELQRLCVFVEDCNRKYEGKIKGQGDTVKILGVGKPTIKTLLRDNASGNIDDAEEIEDTSIMLQINQIRYFNYMVGDIDKAQAVKGLMNALSEETSEGLANEVDKYIAGFATDENVEKLYSSAKKVVAGNASDGAVNILDVLDAAIEKLYERDVKPTTKIVATVTPRFFTLFKQAYIKADTDNSALLKNGKVAMYGNVIIKMSNNVATSTNGTVDNIMLRTQRAIAFVNPMTHTEPYRPEKKFADAVKGFTLFDGKVVRPKEVLNINVKYA